MSIQTHFFNLHLNANQITCKFEISEFKKKIKSENEKNT